MIAYSNPARAGEPYALCDVWIARFARGERESEPGDPPSGAGWYWCYCFPGCMPDSEWRGPYRSSGAALRACREDAHDGRPLPEDGHLYRSSRRYPRDPETVCYTVDTSIREYSYVGRAKIDGSNMHAWRVRPIKGRTSFRPYYVFSLNIGNE